MDSYAPVSSPTLYSAMYGAMPGVAPKKRTKSKRQRGGRFGVDPAWIKKFQENERNMMERRRRGERGKLGGLVLGRKGGAGSRRKKQRGQGIGLGALVKGAAEVGVKLGRSKQYKRMGAVGARGHYKAHRRPWAV